MTRNQPQTPAVIQLVNPNAEVTDRIFVTVEGQDYQRSLSELGLSFDATEREIMDQITPVINEEFGVNIRNHYKIRKAVSNRNIYVIPSSVAGII
ncbi:MAG TPA: hypothetical protein P5136_00905 [Methanofastidiosum sp.]|nr:hypothetical protein [Methanofastidiosum sp.]